MASGNHLKKWSFTYLGFPAESGIQIYDVANPMPLFLEECKNENWFNYSVFSKVWRPRFENNGKRVMSKGFQCVT